MAKHISVSAHHLDTIPTTAVGPVDSRTLDVGSACMLRLSMTFAEWCSSLYTSTIVSLPGHVQRMGKWLPGWLGELRTS